MFTIGGEGRHELERIVASDFSRAQISIKLQSMSSDLVLEQVEQADARAKELFAGTGISVLTTGSGRLFSTLDHYLVMSQLSSFGTAFVTVFGVIFIVFRSFRFGLLTIVPNLLPVVAVLGVMGYLDISMNIATVMVASVALGVVDDDTIHFINRYRREVAAGATTDEAIATATAHEGRASLTTAIINSCGYAVLLMSEYRPTAWFGGLLALTMAVAFLAEVLILPATIKLLPRMFGAEALRRRPAPGRGGRGLIARGALPPPRRRAVAVAAGRPRVADDWPRRPSRDTLELRARAFVEEKAELSPQLRLTASAFVEGLVRRHPDPPGWRIATHRDRRTSCSRSHDAFIECTAGRLDLRAGLGRVVWGRLDEVQPTDVVNPLDVSRFFFEGRSEARLPVALVRARVFLSDRGIDRGRLRSGLPPRTLRPARRADVAVYAARRARGCDRRRVPGDRVPDAAAGDRRRRACGDGRQRAGRRPVQRDDWPRGLERLGVPRLRAVSGVRASGPVDSRARRCRSTARHPRFTMIGGDFETVRGEWGIRGEVAAFVRDTFQAVRAPRCRRVVGRRRRRGRSARRQLPDQRHGAVPSRGHRPADSGDPLRISRG